MTDFTSSLYLGLRHPHGALPAWPSLTSGVPARIGEVDGSAEAACRLAALVGCESAVAAPSTLHVMIDLASSWDPCRDVVVLDAGAYPVARVAASLAKARGVPVVQTEVRRLVESRCSLPRRVAGRRWQVLVDGLDLLSGSLAPLGPLVPMLEKSGGCVFVDDTQAVGVLGREPSRHHPFGLDGGGSLQATGVSSPSIVFVASLAKAFGAPIAFLAGARAFVGRFASRSPSRLHHSPPSAAGVAGALAALDFNAAHGAAARRGLSRLVDVFRTEAGRRGFELAFPLEFPYQAVRLTLPGGGRSVGHTVRSGPSTFLRLGQGATGLVGVLLRSDMGRGAPLEAITSLERLRDSEARGRERGAA